MYSLDKIHAAQRQPPPRTDKPCDEVMAPTGRGGRGAERRFDLVKKVQVKLTWPEKGFVNLYPPEVEHGRFIRQRIGWGIVQIGLKIMMGLGVWEWYVNCDKPDKS